MAFPRAGELDGEGVSGKDQATIDFYATEAQAYATRGQPPLTSWLGPFLSRIPAGGRILELGCGAGQDSEAMLAAGYDVTPTDGAPELAHQAEARLGRPVAVLLFEDIAFVEEFDGVWESTPGKWRIEYDEWEFCHILSGLSVISSDDGETRTAKPGDSFVIRPGFRGAWEVLETTRKEYVIRL